MPVNQTLSNFSDLSFRTAFVIYALALVLSLVYYGRMQTVIQAHRERKEARREREKVAVGADASPVSNAGTGDSVGNDEQDPSAVDAALDGDELAKKERKADKFGGMTQALIWLGLILHLLSIVLRGFATKRFPLGNLYEYMLVITFGALVVAAVALQHKERRTLWPWILTPLMVLMFYGATELYAESAPVVPALQSYWLPVHVATVSLGGSLGIVSGLFSVLHLLRRWQPKGNEHGFMGAVLRPLPTAKKLDQIAYRIGVIALPTLGLGIILGAIWAESAWNRFWGWDPKETMSFVTWILYAAYLHARQTAAFKKAAPWINVLATAAMIFNLFFINLVVSGLHSYAGLN